MTQIAETAHRGLSADEVRKIQHLCDNMDGWLWPDAAWFTAYIMNLQKNHIDSANAGGAVEFGTYKGKYLSILYYQTSRSVEPVIGYDIFKLVTEDEVRQTFEAEFGDADRLTLVKADTKSLTASAIVKEVGCAPRFISIDAEHTAPAVINDLTLAHAVLADGGIVAVDDFTNVHCPGVTEGTISFLNASSNTRLAPFASCCNKLFITTKEHQPLYRDYARKHIDDVTFTTSASRFYTRTRSQNDQMLCRYPVWVISHVKGSVVASTTQG